MLAIWSNFTGAVGDITTMVPLSGPERERIEALNAKQAMPFEKGGNSCHHCGRLLMVRDYLGHYDGLFHVKGYECPGCGHSYTDRSPLKDLKYVSGEWAWVERRGRLHIQKWNPAKVPAGKAGSRV